MEIDELGDEAMDKVLQEVKLEGCFNFRDLGGYETVDGRQTKRGMLFRSGNLSRLTDKDIAVFQELGIKNICDLRDNDEVGKHPDPEIEGATWHHISMINDEEAVKQPGDVSSFESKLMGSKPGELLLELNREMVSNIEAVQKIFKILIDEPQSPMVFHCMAGKDRTGAVAALILSALGVPREVIEQDYLDTNLVLDEMQKGFKAIGYTIPAHIDRDVVNAMYEARVEYIQAYFNEIESRYGSVDTYLMEALGLTNEDIAVLKNHLLDK